ncbi:hypothetical protein AX15_002622 [Amanita polypyramis BW_CC]|nr:hypothetical protein AX15_002622 [Amanita polypyramis BW_CC]
MSLGEEPITAYFPRVASRTTRKPTGSNAKRKQKEPKINTTLDVKCLSANDPGPSRKRTRRATTSSLSSISSGTPPPAWDLFDEAPKTKRPRRNRAINKASSVISIDDGSSDDTTRKVEAGFSASANTTRKLGSSKLFPGIQKEIPVAKGNQELHSRPVVPHIDIPGDSRIPLSAVPKQPKWTHESRRYNSSSTNARLTPKTKIRRKKVDARTIHDDGSDVEILSSQVLERQDELFLHPSGDPASPQSIAAVASTEDHSHQTGAICTPLDATFAPDNKDCSLINNNDAVVDSSQTQNILLNVSPHRPRIHKHLFVPDVDSLYGDEDNESIENIVQSSQTQCEVDLQPIYQATKQLFKCHRGSLGPHALARTLSDILFPVPRRDASFSVEDSPTQTCDAIGVPHASDVVAQDDSATEPDSDYEMVSHRGNNAPRQDTLGVSTHSHSLAADQTQNSGDWTQADARDENYESLPNAVKDFQAMFNSDGSHPPDFLAFLP